MTPSRSFVLSAVVALAFCLSADDTRLTISHDPIVNVTVAAEADSLAVIETSVDLIRWVPVSTVPLAPEAPMVEFADDLADRFTQRFYRSRATTSAPVADVIDVNTLGSPGSYTFSVQILSPDLGCEQYADWWEVLNESGELLYRRVLAHSHVTEQPFTRSGGPVPMTDEDIVWIRAHMHPTGFGGTAWKGSVRTGFQPTPLPGTFAASVAATPPLPTDCAF